MTDIIIEKQDKELAEKTHKRILSILNTVREAEDSLEHNYVDLAKLILKIQTETLWIPLGYESWKKYFNDIQNKFGKGRTQLYGYLGTVKALLPSVDSKDLIEMGVSKAGELKKAVVATGKAPSPELIQKAVSPGISTQDLRQFIQKEFDIVDHQEKGDWVDLKGVYFTEEEKAVFEKATLLAKKIDPPISASLPGHAQFKEVLMRWSEEFISQWEGFVDAGQ